MAWNKTADRFLRPIFDLLKPIPPIAWIPIMIMWFGIGLGAKAAVIFMGAAIPCLINSYTGIKQTSAVHVWVARTFGASKNKILFRVAIPTALPYIFTGLRISLANSWIALVAAELLASTDGLGFMIQMGRTFTRTDIVVVGMLTIGTIGAILAFLLQLVEDKFVKRRRRR
jgi:NitT/TauT family transport system permease protein/taurine transport system permease protein